MNARSQRAGWRPDREPGLESPRADAQIRAGERLLWRIVESSRQAIAIKDLDGRYLRANNSWQELFHPDAEAVVGKTDYDLFARARADALRVADLEAVAAGATAESDERARDGYGVPVDRFALYDDDGRPCGICCITAPAHTEREETLRSGEKQVLDLIASGAPLERVLTELMLVIEGQTDGMLCSVLLLDADGERVRHGAAPSLPEAYCRAIDGERIGPKAGSCGTAAYRREAVVVEDVLEDPLWEDYRAIATQHGLRACWSTPIFSTDGHVLGTFAMYYREPRSPSPAELRLTSVATHLAGIAIERVRAEERLRRIEDELRQAQKMEAVGRLAGGIAHDFNNLLTAIGGYSEFLLEGLPEDTRLRADALEIRKAAERAGTLTRQLLAFSRRTVVKLESLDPNELVADMDKLLRRLIGADIELVTLLEPAAGRFEGDRGQFEQAIVNLALNARDAMPDGGKLAITTANVVIGPPRDDRLAATPPGRYVVVRVRDTGVGMDAATRARIFEPFFTTKGVGSGTGLGLATVYAVVEQSRGRVLVESEPGEGTTFELYLPQTDRPEPAAGEELRDPVSVLGSETILLVDDEESLRSMAARALRDHGYRVLEAHYGSEALEVWGAHEHEIDLVVSDIVLPGMSGVEIAERLAVERPGLPIVLMSGYTGAGDVPTPAASFLEKPFSPATLLGAVREALDRSVRG